MEWFEDLPDKCPPEDAYESSGQAFYRIAEGDPVKDSDFFSQKKMDPGRIFSGKGIDECIIRAVSMFDNVEDARSKLKLPKFKNCCIAEVVLNKKDGLVKQTFKQSHYSWWRTKMFDITVSKIV